MAKKHPQEVYKLAFQRLLSATLNNREFLLITELPLPSRTHGGRGPEVSFTYIGTKVDEEMWKDVVAVKKYWHELED